MDLQEILKTKFGLAEFRPAQREVVDLVMRRRNVIAVMPTGSGKSLCYQLPALALSGLTLVVSPLIALMKDQVDHLEKLGIPAAVINSSVPRDVQRSRIEQALSGKVKLLYVAPERFQNDGFRSAVRRANVSLFAVDEAHCVSTWGHDFRPDYLRLRRAISDAGNPPVVALTATATPAVRSDIATQLGIENAHQLVSGFDRPNLYLEVREVATASEKVKSILSLCAWGGTGIVYAGTRRNVEDLHRSMVRSGVDAVAYHAGLSVGDRKAVQESFMSGNSRVIVATNAFGMGIDRPDVRFVVHADIPDSLEAYYQEVGRAGRDGAPAHGLLLFNFADKWIPELFIDASHPAPEFLKQVFRNLLATKQPVLTGEHWRRAASRMDPQFYSAITILQRAGYLERVRTDAGPGIRILRPGDRELSAFDFKDLERRRQFEERKLAMMLQYASRFKKHCYRSFVLRYFGEWSHVRDCGNCSRCAPHRKIVPASPRAGVAIPIVPHSTRVGKATPAAKASVETHTASGDSTIVALKVLSCILRASEQLGREKVAQILAGSKDSGIQSYRHLTTYGILANYSTRSIVAIIDFLISDGYIDGGNGYRPVIRVTSKGRQFMKERAPLAIPGV